MTEFNELRRVIAESGMTMTSIAELTGIKRETLYNRLNGIGEFSAPEIIALADVLHLSKKQRDYIFLTKRL